MTSPAALPDAVAVDHPWPTPVPARGPITVSAENHGAAWDAYVLSRPETTGYHLWRWREVFERAFGHECVYLAARSDVQVVGILPLVKFRSPLFGRFLVSLPFVNYGGVVADSDDAARALLEAAQRELATHRGKHVELRHMTRCFPELPVKQHKVQMHLPLVDSAEAAWKALDSKVRNQVRKAEKSELTSVTGGLELVPEFYPVFARNMRDLGTPVYSVRLFEEVLRQFPDAAHVHVVRLGATPIAAGLTYGFREIVENPWASSLREHRALCPNMLLYWHMIRDSIARGYRTFDFGRSTPNEGTYQFKTQWGAQPTPVSWEYALAPGTALPDQSPKNSKFEKLIEIWQKLPLPVANALGPLVVRNVP